MKSSLVIVLFLIVLNEVYCARDPVQEQIRRQAAIACVRETKVKLSSLKKYRAGDFSDDSMKGKVMKFFNYSTVQKS
jgi:hypothetical protein